MTYLTKSEFAARRGWSKSYVSKLASQDRLVLTVDGKVDVEATEALLAESADPSKAAVAARHEEHRVERDVRSHLQPGGDTPAVQPLVQQPGKGLDFQKARAHREFYLAQLAEAEFNKVQGNLVERKSVEEAAFAAGRTLRDLVFGLAPQLAAELTGMSDSWEVEKRLTGAFRQVFDDAAKMSGADLNQAMTQS
ncbi:terminase small subunit [Pseudomonas guariconensis]|uniref:Terminase small subunit n=1 Tax=Pseudomonas guariconensis TaxID=1288410 RepID=A0AAX0VPF1_9PSED|nr:terminase small subunit [Pseudomonas guariconensis]PLV09703.1 terminase small subunit [Pseudomonas guariconensis]PLV19986.1 terminase small subunit [Pseudomonas guariconensis]PLV26377.1 terminase small subunit [Pseudomonas guariconensis]